VGATRLGVPFQAVRYETDTHREYGRIVTLRLDHAMPALFVSLPDHPRSGIAGLRIPNRAGLLVVCDDPGFAEAVLEVVQPALVRWARQYPINLSIDGDSLVSVGAPVPPDQLLAYVEALDDIAAALSAAPSLDHFSATKPATLSFYQRPAWVYRPRDDSIMAGAQISQAGFDHQAVDVVGIPSRDSGSQGSRTATRHVTARASRPRCSSTPVGQMLLPFGFPVFANQWNGYGDPLAFFGPGFDDYAFASPDPVVATTIVESMRDFLSTADLPAFAITGNRVHVRPRAAQPDEFERLTWMFAEFFSYVPAVIWRDLGRPAAPFPARCAEQAAAPSRRCAPRREAMCRTSAWWAPAEPLSLRQAQGLGAVRYSPGCRTPMVSSRLAKSRWSPVAITQHRSSDLASS
jgi:hypothetical protein